MGMFSHISSLPRRALQEYSNKGLKPLIANGFRFVARDFWLETLIDRRSISQSELRKLASEEGKIWYMKEENPILIDQPSHPELQGEFDAYPSRYLPEKPFVCEVPDCYILGKYAVGTTEEGKLIAETAPVYKGAGSIKKLGVGLEQYLRIAGLKRTPAQKYKHERVLPLIMPYSGYYHWMTEYLPKLRLLEYYIKKTGHKPTILVEYEPRKFVKETLETFGYSYKEWDSDVARIGRLIIPLHRTHTFNYYKPSLSNYNPSRNDLYWLRNKVRSKVVSDRKEEPEKKIYISRQKSSRKVLNYDEMSKVLSEFGFESYILEDLSFSNQARLLADADIVMGPHGAGLINTIFADDPLIIELLSEDKLKPHFYFLSKIMGFEYEAIVTEAEKDDLVVDIESLRPRLESII